MKKTLSAIGVIFGIAILAQFAFAAAYPPALGGTGTTKLPSSGSVLIGNGAGTYTPALITPGTDIIITNASGSVTVAVRSTDFLPSSTVYVATVNGQSGAVTITSSTLGTATNTISLFNGNNFATTTIQSVLNALSATGLLTYNSSTGAFGYTSSSLALGSASHNSTSDFLASSTIYVTSVNGGSGVVTVTSSSLGVVPFATTTINGIASLVFRVVGDNVGITSTVSGATTTFSIINTGNWAGTWQGVNSTTFYLATNPNGYITTSTFNATGTAFSIVGWNSAGTGLSSTSSISISSSTGAISVGTTTFPAADYLYLLATSTNANIAVTNGSGGNFSFGIVSGAGGQNDQIVAGNNLVITAGGQSVKFVVNSANGFVTIGNSGLYNSPLSIGGNPNTSSAPELFLGSSAQSVSSISGGNANGTVLGSNQQNAYNGDFLNFEINSSTELRIASSGNIFSNGNINASGTITVSGVPVLTSYTTTTPAGNNNTLQFNNGLVFGGISQLTYNSSTGQFSYSGLASDNPGSSITTGGGTNWSTATDTEVMVITDQGVAHNNTNLFYVNETSVSSTQGTVTIASVATSSSPLNIRVSGSLNKSGIKCDGLTVGISDANGACYGFDLAENGSSSRQGINGSATHGTSGNFITFTNSGTPIFAVASSGLITMNNLTSSLLETNANGLIFGVPTNTYYLATNPSGYITSSSIAIGGTTTSTINIGPGLAWASATGTLYNSGVTSLANVTGSVALTGTANEITISTSSNSITFGTPQAIGTNSNVQFGNVTTTNESISGVASDTALQSNSLVVNGNVTSTGLTVSSGALFQNGFTMFGTSFIEGVINTVYSFPSPAQLAAGATCGTTNNVTEVGACGSDDYAAGALLGNAVQINVGSYSYPSSTFTSIMNFNQQGILVDLEGATGGGTVFNWGGASTTLAATGGSASSGIITFNDCNSNQKRPALQMQNITLGGFNASTTGGGLTGIYAGGTFGACATQIDNVYVGGFTYDLQTASNTYMFELSNSILANAFRAIWQHSPSNSGESMIYYNDKEVDPAGPSIGGISSSSNYVYLDTNSSPSTQFELGSIDDGQLGAACGNSQVSVSQLHMENTQPTVYGSYDYINEANCASGGTQVNTTDVTFMQDGTSTAGGAPNEFVNAGSVFTGNGDVLAHNGVGTSTARFVNNTNSTANSVITLTNINNYGAGATSLWPAVVGTNGPQNAVNGTLSSVNNGYVYGWTATSNGLVAEAGGGTTAGFWTPAGASYLNGEVFDLGGLTNIGSSSLYINGDIGFKVSNNSVSSTIPSGGAVGWPAEWQVCNSLVNTTDTMPYATGTVGTMLTFKNINAGTCNLAVTSTDLFRLAGSIATTTLSVTLSPGSSTQFANYGILSNGQGVWDQLWVR